MKNNYKYYVIYNSYTEYNQFEGSWDVSYEVFNAHKEAKTFAEEQKRKDTLIAGPLMEV